MDHLHVVEIGGSSNFSNRTHGAQVNISSLACWILGFGLLNPEFEEAKVLA